MKKLFHTAIAFCFSAVLLYAQPQACPPDDPGCTPWDTTSMQYLRGIQGYYWSVSFRYRLCNGVIQVQYTEPPQIIGSYGLLSDTTIHETGFGSAMEMIDMRLIVDRIPLIYTGVYRIADRLPSCPDSTVFVKFYSASCGIWLKCSYELDPATMNRVCEQGFDEPFPDYSAGGTTKVDVWKWQPCGETCCERSYTLCWQEQGNEVYPFPHREVKSISKRKLIPCSDEPSPGNPVPKYAKPCLDGC